MSWFLFVSPLLAQSIPCPERTNRVALSESMTRAQQAFDSGELVLFESQLAQAGFTLACVNELLSPEEAQTYHWLRAVSLWDPRAPEIAAPSLLALEQLPPPGAPLWPTLPDGVESLGVPHSLPPPWQGQLFVDGQPTRQVSPRSAYLLQHVHDDAVLGTWYVFPGQQAPYPRLRRRLRTISVAAGAAALVTLGGTVASNQQLYAARDETDPKYDDDWFRRLRARNNALFVSSVVLGGTSAATLVTIGVSYIQ